MTTQRISDERLAEWRALTKSHPTSANGERKMAADEIAHSRAFVAELRALLAWFVDQMMPEWIEELEAEAAVRISTRGEKFSKLPPPPNIQGRPISQEYFTDNQMAERFQVSRATIWRWASEGEIPKPIKLTKRTTRWLRSEIEAHEAHLAERAKP